MSLLRKLNINNKSLISVKQFTNNDIINIFELANKFKKHYIKHGNSFVNYNNNKGIGLLFFQPSTRTRMSFEIAAKNIGLNALLETNPTNNLSIAKQESLSDTLKTMSQYVDTIILRHPDEEEVFNNIENINIPIINAGWGEFEHPTQALIDLYTFKHNVKSLKNTNLAIVGDPNTRTAKSITELASKFNMSISYIYPDIYSHNINNISVNKLIANNHNDFQKAVQNQDILYYSNFTGTVINDERDGMYNNYYLPLKFLEKNNIKIYSPLPRRPNEMDFNADNTPYQLSFQAIRNSVYLRMALIHSVLN